MVYNIVMAPIIFQVDAFTSTPFSGNPAVVCLLNEPRDDRWLQYVAREMNVPATAFLRWQKGGFDLRWFTPTVEIDLCGHATLASAHIMWELEYLRPDEKATFYTLSGPLVAERREDLIELNRRIVERLQILRSKKSLAQLARFSIGMLVEFNADDGRTITGMVARLNQRTATVVTASGRWRVSPSLLRKAAQATGTASPRIVALPRRHN